MGGADTARRDDEVVGLSHTTRSFHAGSDQSSLSLPSSTRTYISSSSSAMTSMRLLPISLESILIP